jgi:type IV pilus assembly protein PilW
MVGQFYINNKQIYRTNDHLSRIQQSLQDAVELLSNDLRLAGYVGCRSRAIPKLLANEPVLNPDPGAGDPVISGGEADANPNGTFTHPAPALSSTLANRTLTDVVEGTDIITVQFGEPCGGFLVKPLGDFDPTDEDELPTHNLCNIQPGPTPSGAPGDTLLVYDCSSTHIFRAATDNSQNSNTLGRIYPAGAQIVRYRAYTYYIGRIQDDPDHNPALYRLDNTQPLGPDNPAELIAGIEDMEIEYGIDTNNPEPVSVSQYQTADQVTDWRRALTVRITLKARSLENNVVPVQQTGEQDYRLHREISATIGLRNRLQ